MDFYTFSLYKTFGPHLALLYGKEEILKDLPNQNHEFLNGEYPYTINPGGPNHEELVSLIGIYEYYENLYNHHYKNKDLSILNKVKKINNLISLHEQEIANPILKHIHERKDLRLIGKNQIKDKDRAPTISFISNKKTSKEISKKLLLNKIATRNDNFYAWRCLKALGIDLDDGVLRLSMVHYNNTSDVSRVLSALEQI